MNQTLTLLAALAVGFIVALAVGRLMVIVGPRDTPDDGHKAHQDVTPSGGGIAILAGAAGALVAARAGGATLDHPAVLPVCSAVLAAAVLGLVDDTRVVSTRLKLAVLSVLAMALVLAGDLTAGLEFAGIAADGAALCPLGFWLAVAGSWLWVMVLVNAVNFQDGANGVAMGSSGLGFVGLAILGFQGGASSDLVLMALAGAAGCAGFLVWNSPAGRLFSGDTGSLAVGMALAGIGLALTREGVNALLVALCVFVMLADVILTIVWRARHDGGLKVLLRPHRHHLYQWLTRSGRTHLQVARLWWGLTAGCIALAAVLQIATRGLGIGQAALVVASSVLLLAVTAAIGARATRKQVQPPDVPR